MTALLCACQQQAQQGPRIGGAVTDSASRRLFFDPGSGKTQEQFQDDRVACAYAVEPWTEDGFAQCMKARGDIVEADQTPQTTALISPYAKAMRDDIDAARAAMRGGDYAEVQRLRADAMRLAAESRAQWPNSGQPGGDLFSPWGNDTAARPRYASDLKTAVAADLAGNYVEALQLYRKIEAAAATFKDKEDPTIVRTKIAQDYEKGLGVPQNYSVAASLYEASISENISSARAPMRLGFFANGFNVPRDTAKARSGRRPNTVTLRLRQCRLSKWR